MRAVPLALVTIAARKRLCTIESRVAVVLEPEAERFVRDVLVEEVVIAVVVMKGKEMTAAALSLCRVPD